MISLQFQKQFFSDQGNIKNYIGSVVVKCKKKITF